MLPLLMLLGQSTPSSSATGPVWKNSGVAIERAPMAALRGTKGGTISFFLRISTEGKVSQCLVTESSGTESLDKASCEVIRRYGEFELARDGNGTAIPGDFRTATSYQSDPRTSEGAVLTLDVTLAHLPASYRRPTRSQVLFDASGGVSSCTIVQSSGNAVVDRVACDQIGTQLKIKPPKSGSDQPAVGLRWVTTSFAADTK